MSIPQKRKYKQGNFIIKFDVDIWLSHKIYAYTIDFFKIISCFILIHLSCFWETFGIDQEAMRRSVWPYTKRLFLSGLWVHKIYLHCPLEGPRTHWALQVSCFLLPHYLRDRVEQAEILMMLWWSHPGFSIDGCVILMLCGRFPFGCVYWISLWPLASAVYLCPATGAVWANLRSPSW